MSKCILLSIKPQHVANILNGLKTIEIRKRFPSDYVGWVYIYVTKGKPYIKECDHFRYIGDYEIANKGYYLNGKVVARFWCDKVEEIKYQIYGYLEHESECFLETKTLGRKELCYLAKLTYDDLKNYLKPKNKGYAIHITKLEIFDKPKEIKDFSVYSHSIIGTNIQGETTSFRILKPLNRAPQSWCYVEV